MKVEELVKELRSFSCTTANARHAADLLEAQAAVIAAYKHLCEDVMDKARYDRLADVNARLAEVEAR